MKTISMIIVIAILAWMIGLDLARADILCGTDVVMGRTGGHMFSRAASGKYREYPIIDIDGTKITALTQYGKVTMTFNEVPMVVWTNREGAVEPQVCSYIFAQKPATPPATQYINPDVCHDEEYPINGQYGITGYGHHQVCR